MNTDGLEDAIRATLRQNVQDVTETTVTRPDLPTARRSRTFGTHRWVAPALAAAAIVLIAGIVANMSVANRHGGSQVMSAGGSLSGTWELVGATTGGRPVAPPSKTITLVVQGDDTVLINDGVNTTTLTGHGADGVLSARFRSTTFAYDPRSATAQGRAILQLLDSLAPNSKRGTQTRSEYRIADGQLTVHTPSGDLVFRQTAPAPADAPSSSASTTETPSTTASLSGSTSASPSPGNS